MLKQMSDMPVGTIGFEARGDVDDDDFEDSSRPSYDRRSPAGERCAFSTCRPQLEDFDGDVVKEEMKFAARHTTAYERVAIVSDESWLGPALRMLSVLVPGQLRGFPVAQLQSAKTWVAAGADERGAPHAR